MLVIGSELMLRVPLYLFMGPEQGLVAGPGTAWFPCHSWPGGASMFYVKGQRPDSARIFARSQMARKIGPGTSSQTVQPPRHGTVQTAVAAEGAWKEAPSRSDANKTLQRGRARTIRVWLLLMLGTIVPDALPKSAVTA